MAAEERVVVPVAARNRERILIAVVERRALTRYRRVQHLTDRAAGLPCREAAPARFSELAVVAQHARGDEYAGDGQEPLPRGEIAELGMILVPRRRRLHERRILVS